MIISIISSSSGSSSSSSSGSIISGISITTPTPNRDPDNQFKRNYRIDRAPAP